MGPGSVGCSGIHSCQGSSVETRWFLLVELMSDLLICWHFFFKTAYYRYSSHNLSNHWNRSGRGKTTMNAVGHLPRVPEASHSIQVPLLPDFYIHAWRQKWADTHTQCINTSVDTERTDTSIKHSCWLSFKEQLLMQEPWQCLTINQNEPRSPEAICLQAITPQQHIPVSMKTSYYSDNNRHHPLTREVNKTEALLGKHGILFSSMLHTAEAKSGVRDT